MRFLASNHGLYRTCLSFAFIARFYKGPASKGMETVVGRLTNVFTITGITLGPRERNGNTSCEEEEKGVRVTTVWEGEVDTALRETGTGVTFTTKCFHSHRCVREIVLIFSALRSRLLDHIVSSWQIQDSKPGLSISIFMSLHYAVLLSQRTLSDWRLDL